MKTIEQGLFDTETVDDYDLVEMLRAASEKVKTRKLLIVGHSQGNFYANAFYKRATAPSSDGASVPLESIGVYSVATPSSYVAGDGEYITSETDKAIAGIVGRVLRKDILPTNTRIEEVANDTGLTAGHSFSDVYLKYRGAEIVGGIEKSLYKLTPKHTNILQNVGMLEDATSPCIAAPERTLAHKAAGLAFAVADPAAAGAKLAVVGAVKGVNAVGLAVGSAGKFVVEKIAGVLGAGQTDSPAAAAGAAANSATTLTVSENTAARGAALESLRPAATPEKHTDILQNVGMSLRVCYQQHDDKWIICFCNNREVVDNRRTFL